MEFNSEFKGLIIKWIAMQYLLQRFGVKFLFFFCFY